MTVPRARGPLAPTQREAAPCGCTDGMPWSEAADGRLRPRFTCGQLLTDEDLTTMVTWAAGKSRLKRFRAGWGVAYGLEVRCDPANRLGVIVGEGYALSCCGDDIVVCDDQPLNLTEAGRRDDPCARPAPPEDAAERERRRARRELNEAIRQQSGTSGSLTAGAVTAVQKRLGSEGPGSSLDVPTPPPWVDVFVSYTEQDVDLRATLRHTDCASAPECVAAKTREWFTLSWRAGGPPDPADDATTAWCDGYAGSLAVLRRYVEEFGGGSPDWATQRQWLSDWIRGHPPRLFCDLAETVADWTDDELAAGHTEVLLKLVLEAREAYTRQPPPACDNGRGVRLARVYLAQAAKESQLVVVRIDNHPPFRRLLSPAAAPARVGETNIGHLVGARWAEACRRLADLGLRAERRDLQAGTSAADLLAALDCGCDPVVACGNTTTLLLVEFAGDPLQGGRVIGFCGEDDAVRSTDVPPLPSGTSGGRTTEETGSGVPVPIGPEQPPPEGPSAGGGAPSTAPATGGGTATPDQTQRREVDLLTEVDGIGEAIATRLVRNGLTLEAMATVPEEELDDLVVRVARVLAPGSRSRARQWVLEARALARGPAETPGGA